MADGSSWDVLKNFPEPDEVITRLNRFGQSAEHEELDNYWLTSCRSPSRLRSPSSMVTASGNGDLWSLALSLARVIRHQYRAARSPLTHPV
jgi:hypothetical protein